MHFRFMKRFCARLLPRRILLPSWPWLLPRALLRGKSLRRSRRNSDASKKSGQSKNPCHSHPLSTEVSCICLINLRTEPFASTMKIWGQAEKSSLHTATIKVPENKPFPKCFEAKLVVFNSSTSKKNCSFSNNQSSLAFVIEMSSCFFDLPISRIGIVIGPKGAKIKMIQDQLLLHENGRTKCITDFHTMSRRRLAWLESTQTVRSLPLRALRRCFWDFGRTIWECLDCSDFKPGCGDGSHGDQGHKRTSWCSILPLEHAAEHFPAVISTSTLYVKMSNFTFFLHIICHIVFILYLWLKDFQELIEKGYCAMAFEDLKNFFNML